jgi:hypothetical protein
MNKIISYINQRIEYYEDEENLNSDIIEELENIKLYVLTNSIN